MELVVFVVAGVVIVHGDGVVAAVAIAMLVAAGPSYRDDGGNKNVRKSIKVLN